MLQFLSIGYFVDHAQVLNSILLTFDIIKLLFCLNRYSEWDQLEVLFTIEQKKLKTIDRYGEDRKNSALVQDVKF